MKTEKLKETMLLYAVTDRAWLGESTLYEQVEAALKGGATFIQLREKNLGYDEFLKEAAELKKLCAEYRVPFVINDNVDIALECDADGVHVGQEDMEAGAVREKIGKGKILGVSAATVEEAILAEKRGADYIGVGAVFPTSTKSDAADVPYDELKAICDAVEIPVVAIGGISSENTLLLKGSGVDGIAVVSAIFASEDIEGAARELRKKSEEMTGTVRVKGAVFDFDGTIIDSMWMWDNVGGEYLKAKGIEPEPDLRKITLPMTLEEAAEYFHSYYKAGSSAEEICEEINGMLRRYYEEKFILKPGVKELLAEIKAKGIKMCIATATKKELVKKCAERNGILEYFEDIITCPELNTSKSVPFIYEKAVELLGVEKEETVIFEDARHAIKTAKNAGFYVIAIEDASEINNKAEIRALADVYLEKVSDSKRLLRIIAG